MYDPRTFLIQLYFFYGLFLFIFALFKQLLLEQTVDFSRIQAWMRVEGKHSDHEVTTT